jgi:DNA-binding transcriptional LysR family regulator
MREIFDTRQLLAFVTVVREGGFTRAARTLGLTQSAIGHSLRALEGDAGCKLLLTVGKQPHLTEAGEELYAAALRILDEMSATRLGLGERGQWGRGRLRVGASAAACQFLLPDVLREFTQCFPEFHISLEVSDSPLSLERLRAHETDIALVLGPEVPTGCRFQALFRDELRFLVSPRHPWAAKGRAVLRELPAQSLILHGKRSRTFQLVVEYFRTENIHLGNPLEVGSTEAIKELAKIGLGIAVLPAWIARREIEEGSLVDLPLGRRKLLRHWGLATLVTRRLHLAEETFIGLCESVCTNFALQLELAAAPPKMAV